MSMYKGGVKAVSTAPAAAIDLLNSIQKAMEQPLKRRDAPFQIGYSPMTDYMDFSPQSYLETANILPQYSIRGKNPVLAQGDSYGKGGRMDQMVDNRNVVSGILAEKMAPHVGSEVGYFYHVAPIYNALRSSGLSADDAYEYVDEFANLYGATSPRTDTLQNLRSASLLQFKNQNKIPFNMNTLTGKGGNDKGFPMMDSHQQRGRAYLEGQYDQAANPKPVNFVENSRGNLENVTVDTHAIRGAVGALEEAVGQGNLNENWLKAGARDTYKKEGRFSLATDVDDGLDAKKTKPYGGVTTQVEYGPMAEIYADAGQKAGASPAEAQALGWFLGGDETGLVSTPRTIARLWHDRVAATAEVLGVPFDKAVKMVGRKEIPIYGSGAMAVGLGAGSDDAAASSVMDNGYYNPAAGSVPTAALYEEPKSSVRKFYDTFQETIGGDRGVADTLLMGAALVPSPIQIPAAATELGLLATDGVNALIDSGMFNDMSEEERSKLVVSP